MERPDHTDNAAFHTPFLKAESSYLPACRPSPESSSPGSMQAWLRYAVSDLELARTSGAPNVMQESLCYHAQQCAERALKAVLVAYDLPARKTHSVGLLLDLLSEHVTVLREVKEAAILTDFAVASWDYG